MEFIRVLRYLILALATVILTQTVCSQELNCNVQVSAQQIQGSNRQIFENMQRDIYEFLNVPSDKSCL
jgi:hypothetical protein